MKLTSSQRLMADDGAPSICFATVEQRTKWWAANPPTAMPLFNLEVRNRDAATEEFARQEAERKRQKSLAGIARMKIRMAMKAVDLTKMRWDSRRCKFVEDVIPVRGAEVTTMPTIRHRADVARTVGATPATGANNWSRINAMTAAHYAKLNDVWDPKYAKLKDGLLVMTVTNRLKGLVKKGGEVKWV